MPKRSDHHRAGRREQVLDAALACMIEHGLNGASMAQIARAAGLSTGAAYVYFAGKKEILLAILERSAAQQIATLDVTTLDEMRARLVDLVSSSASAERARLAQVNLEIVLAARRDPALSAIIIGQATAQRAAVRRCLLTMRDAGKVDPDADIDTAVDAVSCIVVASCYEAILELHFDLPTRIHLIDRQIDQLRPTAAVRRPNQVNSA